MITVVCMYICLISYISDSKETQAWPSFVGQLPSLILLKVCTDSILLTYEYQPSETFSLNHTILQYYRNLDLLGSAKAFG